MLGFIVYRLNGYRINFYKKNYMEKDTKLIVVFIHIYLAVWLYWFRYQAKECIDKIALKLSSILFEVVVVVLLLFGFYLIADYDSMVKSKKVL